jgi:hypothetical protein
MAKSRRDAAPATPQDKPKAEPLRDADGAAAERSASGRASEPRAQSAPLSRTGPDTGRKPGRVPDVVAALTPADVETAERQLIVLATQHGGAQAGRRVDAGGVTVELDIPRERYADFARAAATLGSFSAPAATSVAAPMVRVDVRLDAPR